MQIAMLDIDGFRVDKALQTPVDALAEWATYQRNCARQYGKENFLITGEVVGELKFSSVFFGRGKSPDTYFDNPLQGQNATGETEGYIRDFGNNALDGTNFHYPTYVSLSFVSLGSASWLLRLDRQDFWPCLLTSFMV